MNTFGNIFRLTSFGESHGVAIGGVIDGMPAGIEIDISAIQHQLDRRRPGQSSVSTSRNEADRVEILSGVFEGKTLGTPIGFLVRNTDALSSDYEELRNLYRPSHADYTYTAKYRHRDHRGGGRQSARETVARVVAGAFAKIALSQLGISVKAYTSQVGIVCLDETDPINLSEIDANDIRCPNKEKATEMLSAVQAAKADGDTLGCVINCVIDGCPAGLGEPVFGKLSAELASAMMSINAAKGVEIGDGFSLAGKRGSEVIDTFSNQNGKIVTTTNHSGGIQGGITNGMPITLSVAFKPIPTLLQQLDTIDINGDTATLNARGRHDPCVAARAVPVVEAMAAIVVFDAYLLNLSARLCRE